MIKIIFISVITIFLTLVLKPKSPEISAIVSVCGGLLILIICFDYISESFNFYISLSEKIGVDNSILKIAVKVISVGILTEFISDLANDFGNSVVSSKVVFGGRVVICVIMLPVVRELVLLLFSFY